MPSNRHPDRAIELLSRFVTGAWYDEEALAHELISSTDDIRDDLAQRTRMPLERQLYLAKFVIEKLPILSRQGHRLLGQVRATIAFHQGTTVRHSDAPPLRYR